MSELSQLPIDEAADAVVSAIEDDGICWLGIGTGQHAEAIHDAVAALMPDRSLYLHSPPPDWDHVIIDMDRLTGWMGWMDDHAGLRFEMKERGIPDHKLPPLPKGVRPEEPDEDDDED